MTDTLPDLDDYEYFEQLGRGTLGVVYRARDRLSNRFVALKWCSADKCDLYDAALYVVYDPELFVPTVTAGVSDDFVYVVSEYQDGGSLAAQLNDLGPLVPTKAARITRTLCQAIEQLHAAGLVHSRLKPTDVLFTDQGQPRLSDLKLIASKVDDDDVFRPPAPDNTITGDVYRLGGILYAALTAQAPMRFGGSVHEEPVAPRKLNNSVPHALQDICLKCLDRSPSARYQSVAQLTEDLDRFLTQRPLQGVEDADALSPWLWLVKYPLAIAIPFGVVSFWLFPSTVAAGLTGGLSGVFLTPTRSWKAPLIGMFYGGVLLGIWQVSGKLISNPPAWILPRESGAVLPWLQWLIDITQTSFVYGLGYVLFGGLTGWAWHSLKVVDQQQRSWLSRIYLVVLFAFPWIVMFDDVIRSFNRQTVLLGCAASFAGMLMLPLGMLLNQLAWWTSARRTTLDNARLPALLGVSLAVLVYFGAPVAWKGESLGGRRPVMLPALLPRIPMTNGSPLDGSGPISDILGATFTHLTPITVVAIGTTVLLAAAGAFPRSTTVVTFIIGLGAVGWVILNSFRRDPGLWEYLPGDSWTGVFFFALGAVIVIGLIGQHFKVIRTTARPPQRELPGFTGRVLIAACAAGLLFMVFCALFAGLLRM